MDRVNELVKKIIVESSFETFFIALPQRVYKRKRKRLAKYLKKQVVKLLPELQIGAIKEKLLKELEVKYSKSEVKNRKYVVYHDDIDVFVSESEDEEVVQECQENPCNDPVVKYSNVEETRRNRDKFDSDTSIKVPENATGKDIFGHPICQRLLTQNHYLSQRSKELTKLKLAPHLSFRSMQIADSVLFSDHLGFPDALLLETPVNISYTLPNSDIMRYEMLEVTEFHELCRILLRNGEFVVSKRIKSSLKFPFEKSFALLSYEARILNIVGSHKNVLSCLGLTASNGIPSLILEYQSMETMKDLLCGNSLIGGTIASQISSGIANGVAFIHTNGVIHNMLVPENISMQVRSSFFIPVLIGFSSSCRIANSKPLTYHQQEKFKDCIHLPAAVRKGQAPPTESSDIFSFGILIQRLFLKVDVNAKRKQQIDRFIHNCFCEDKDFVVNFSAHSFDVFDL